MLDRRPQTGLVKATDDLRILLELEREQVERVREVRRLRDAARASRALDQVREAAADPKENLMPHILEAVRAYCTEGEIMGQGGGVRPRHGAGGHLNPGPGCPAPGSGRGGEAAGHAVEHHVQGGGEAAPGAASTSTGPTAMERSSSSVTRTAALLIRSR